MRGVDTHRSGARSRHHGARVAAQLAAAQMRDIGRQIAEAHRPDPVLLGTADRARNWRSLMPRGSGAKQRPRCQILDRGRRHPVHLRPDPNIMAPGAKSVLAGKASAIRCRMASAAAAGDLAVACTGPIGARPICGAAASGRGRRMTHGQRRGHVDGRPVCRAVATGRPPYAVARSAVPVFRAPAAARRAVAKQAWSR